MAKSRGVKIPKISKKMGGDCMVILSLDNHNIVNTISDSERLFIVLLLLLIYHTVCRKWNNCICMPTAQVCFIFHGSSMYLDRCVGFRLFLTAKHLKSQLWTGSAGENIPDRVFMFKFEKSSAT